MDGVLERHFFRTREGFGVPLPFPVSPQEATLPGNVFIIEDDGGVTALVTFDESTRTGSIFCKVAGWHEHDGRDAGAWTMWQPMPRDRFFGAGGPVSTLLASLDLTEGALAPAWEGGKLEADTRLIG
jgi:hypothetical protein